MLLNINEVQRCSMNIFNTHVQCGQRFGRGLVRTASSMSVRVSELHQEELVRFSEGTGSGLVRTSSFRKF